VKTRVEANPHERSGIVRLAMTRFVCTRCSGTLSVESDVARCVHCATTFPVENSIVDFSGGAYFDSFDPQRDINDEMLLGLENEMRGTRQRVLDFYLPRVKKSQATVLDVGCGNGLSVDLLAEKGHDAWGVDLSRLRKWQWRERKGRSRLGVADGRSLPFPAKSFDFVVASGVIEHIGVEEWRDADGIYVVVPKASRDEERLAFLSELLRVVKDDGVIYLDAPNGLFPIDFWHATKVGAARWHSPDEGFLPTPGELRELTRSVGRPLRVRFLSPHRRLRFGQVRQSRTGRMFTPLVSLALRVMTFPGLRWLARTPLNPFLVVEISPRVK
jgi:SAM-dependent methyltransferase